MSTFDRFWCLIGAHRWANAADPETGALFERCVTCGRETDTAPWARERPGSPPPNDSGGSAGPVDFGGWGA
jgi:hypothetical protein